MSRNIMITGASSGIGSAVAMEFARRGYGLGLAARRLDALETLRGNILQRHPDTRIAIRALDVTEYDKVPGVLREIIDELDGLDIVFANAGIGLGGKIGKGEFAAARRTIETNVIGAMATVEAAAEYFRERGRGHIVATSSVAAFRGLPGNGAYSASKAALSVWMEALRAELYRHPIDVTVLHPGYIDTPINNMLSNRPFLISLERGASLIADLIERRAKNPTVPRWPWAWLARVLAVAPTRFISRMG